ncbi:5-deoxy-glucuronate isomerase (plasmid) [Entomospira nematocerorum]|uniref:5-deoxy-glucuronate isomerase n=1 Tax=Entomospira nematocerorum TaxID=2719987 RepID=A0A968KVU8_9SPIO|nr:5-deoxy-glucuronate isomerase [Entomospira nematocera]NIZ47718.1 5-deoxy-glucuronate isomerase [Entomospira nematocera]WDI34645.1 5-deoxy-glucuronate isomerase [Entomospira nematocera]
MSLKRVPNHETIEGVTILHDLTKEVSALSYIAFKVIDMQALSSYMNKTILQEVCIVVLQGEVTVRVEDQIYANIGKRHSVFDRIPTDSVYIGNNHSYEIISNTVARVALCYAYSDRNLPSRMIAAKDNSIEERGKFNNRRIVHNILPDTVDYAQNLLVVEVYTDGGNFSSYPPHKHDQNNLPEESLLEEIYYHEISPPQGFVFQRVYTEDRSIDETMSVENKEVVLVPKGYHPVGVPDGYTSYYLNIMAGPVRIWKFHNDKHHDWILSR